jgi:hypothetical protein
MDLGDFQTGVDRSLDDSDVTVALEMAQKSSQIGDGGLRHAG